LAVLFTLCGLAFTALSHSNPGISAPPAVAAPPAPAEAPAGSAPTPASPEQTSARADSAQTPADPETADANPVVRAAGRRPAPPVIAAPSAILVDAASGQVLYERNPDAQRPMASTTKIMTALLFCENVKEDAVITASHYACITTGSSLHLHSGERVAAKDLLHAILMRSANDACVAAAEHISGSESAFVDRMNARAGELGCRHTHFANAHGLHSPDHYSSARDLATIARAAMQEPRIEEVVRTQYYTIERPSGSPDRSLRNHSHFLGKFPGADGVKTGWTVPAGHCYVGSATIHGWRLISVVLHSPNYVGETKELMKYGFDNFAPHLVAPAGQPAAPCPVEHGASATVPTVVKSNLQVVSLKWDHPQVDKRYSYLPLSAPVPSGAAAGAVEAWSDGVKLAEAPLITAAPVAAEEHAVLSIRGGGRWRSALFTTTFLAMGLVSLRYGTRVALTKSARRRRRRIAQSMRRAHRFR
jgi:D-alanyl-D-alanine carboxypeptidase (penicillin-binding protein 5/6)